MKRKQMTVRQAFKLFKTLKAKQSRRSAWLGASPVYTARMNELQANARECLNSEQFRQTHQPYELDILKAILGNENEKTSQ